MSINLEEKLLLNRAKKYVAKLEGVSSYSISLLGKNDFFWHRKKLMDINSLDNEIKSVNYNLPINEDYLYEEVIKLSALSNEFDCYLFYEGLTCVAIHCIDFKKLLESIFKLNNTYDLSLAFILPDRILVISDNEYQVQVYYIDK